VSTLVQPRCVNCYAAIEPELVSFGSDQCRTCRDPGAATRVAKAASINVKVPAKRRRREAMTQGMLIWALASAGLVIIGAFGPWAKVLVISINGTDVSHDGWVVASAAFFGGLLVYVRRATPSAGSWALLAGIVAMLPAIYDRQHLTHWISNGGPLTQALVHVGWGLNLVIAASISLAICGVTGLIRSTTS
jgi:hypothetical protein